MNVNVATATGTAIAIAGVGHMSQRCLDLSRTPERKRLQETLYGDLSSLSTEKHVNIGTKALNKTLDRGKGAHSSA